VSVDGNYVSKVEVIHCLLLAEPYDADADML